MNSYIVLLESTLDVPFPLQRVYVLMPTLDPDNVTNRQHTLLKSWCFTVRFGSHVCMDALERAFKRHQIKDSIHRFGLTEKQVQRLLACEDDVALLKAYANTELRDVARYIEQRTAESETP